MITDRQYESVRKPANVVAWLYFIFMAYMLLNPQPPIEFIPEYTFSWLHFLAFSALGVLVGLARRNASWLYLLALLWGWSVGSECLQPYTGRYFEFLDIVQNVVGSTSGLFVVWLVRRLGIERSVPEHKVRSGAVAILFRPPFSLSDDEPIDFAKRQVLVVRRSATVVAPGALCFPGGGLEKGESPAEAAAREFREEVGVEIRVGATIAENTTPSGAPLYWFVAELAAPENGDPKLTLQRSEIAGYEWKTFPELLDDPDFLPNNLEIVRNIVEGKIDLRGKK